MPTVPPGARGPGIIPIPPSPALALRALAERGHTVAEIERVLGLSPGYLSKVRHRAVRPSRQLIALLEVLRAHPDALATIRNATRPRVGQRDSRRAPRAPRRGATPPPPLRVRPAAGGSALGVLVGLEADLRRAGVRWALAGSAGLAAHGASLPREAGVDIIVHDEDRQVLHLLREKGYGVAHHAPELSICRTGASDPNESLRVHFPVTPPLSTALARTVQIAVAGRPLPVVDGTVLALGCLLSHRSGSEPAARAALRANVVTLAELRRRLRALDRLPPTRSPSVLRVFDRALARSRLAALGAP